MKKFLYVIPIIVGMFVLSCADKDNRQDPSINGETEVQFELGLLDNPNSTKAYELGSCSTTDELIAMAQAGTLQAHITLSGPTQNGENTIDIDYISHDGKFITKAMILGAGTYEITQFTVTNGNDVLFSGVNEQSDYAQFVKQTLPQYFNIGHGYDNNYPSIGLYEKGTIDLYLLCVLSETAEDFGFVKWNFNLITLHCLPFAVNICNETGEDVVGHGTLMIESGDFINGDFINPSTVSSVIFPPSDQQSLAKLCIPVNEEDDPENTYMRLTMAIEGLRPFSSIVKMADLLNYKEQAEWNQDFNFLHFNFCEGTSWFFPNQFIYFNVTNCPDNGDQEMASGYLLIYDNADKSHNSYKIGNLVDSVPFPNGDNNAQICIPDNYLVGNDVELYHFELYTKYKGVVNPLPVENTVTVSELLQYKGTDAWDLVNRVLNINLCDCQNWIFPCQEYSLGTYVFEDLWPNPGDYDFNDLVVEYHLSKIKNSQNKMTRLELDCDLKALGAGYRNCAFAIRLEGLEFIQGNHSVTRTCDHRDGNGYVPYDITGTFWHTLDNQKVEITPDNVFIVPVIENIDQKFRTTHTGSSQINTYQNSPTTIGQGYKYRLVIDFATPVSINFNAYPIEIPQANRAREINMPLVKPTANCNYQGLIGVDPNNPGSHKFFTYGSTHRPWALDVPYLNIRYAVESNSILNLYNPEFDAWCSNLYVDPPTWWHKSGIPTNFFFNASQYPELY